MKVVQVALSWVLMPAWPLLNSELWCWPFPSCCHQIHPDGVLLLPDGARHRVQPAHWQQEPVMSQARPHVHQSPRGTLKCHVQSFSPSSPSGSAQWPAVFRRATLAASCTMLHSVFSQYFLLGVGTLKNAIVKK